MTNKPYHLSVKALVMNRKGQGLVLKRSNNSKNNAGCWEFPGGKTDDGERFDEALIREIKEETGLTVTLVKVLGAAESHMADRCIAYLIMEALAPEGEVRLSEEHEEYKWIKAEEIYLLNLCPQFVKFADGLRK